MAVWSISENIIALIKQIWRKGVIDMLQRGIICAGFVNNICFAVSHALTVTAWAYTITLITYWWAYFLWQCPHLFLKPFIILSSTTFWFLEPWFNYFLCESFCFVLKVICLHDASSLVVEVLAIIHFNDALLQPSLTVFSQLKSPTLHNFSSAGG